MQILYDRIRKDGIVRAGNVLKVDRFLNHQMDIHLFQEIGKEFKRRFEGEEINKILTIEASGIGIACIVAEYFDVPVVFAKKTKTKNIAGEVYMILLCPRSSLEKALRFWLSMIFWQRARH